MSISDSDLQKIKSIVDLSISTELPKAIANLATKDDIHCLNAEIESLKKQNEDLSIKVQHFEARCNILEEELELHSRKIKGKNIILTIPNDSNVDPQDKIQGLSRLLLGESQQMSEVIKLSEYNSFLKFKIDTGSNKNASVMLRNAAKLKGTGAFVQRDLSKQSQHKRRILLAYRKVIKTKQPTEAVQIKNNSLVVANKPFYLNNNNTLKHKNEDGDKILRDMFGELDFGAVKLLVSNQRHNQWSRPIDSILPMMPLLQNSQSSSTLVLN